MNFFIFLSFARQSSKIFYHCQSYCPLQPFRLKSSQVLLRFYTHVPTRLTILLGLDNVCSNLEKPKVDPVLLIPRHLYGVVRDGF